MDPLSIISSTTALISCAAKLVKLLHDLYGTLEDAPLLLSSIITECHIVHTSLCVIQDRQSRNATVRNARSDQVFDTFDIALSGCALILSVLEKDVQSCIVANKNPQDAGAVKRAKIVLEKSHLQELLSQLRGQQQALTLLLSTLQSQSIDEMHGHVQDNQDLLQGIARVAKRFYVDSAYEPSIAEASSYRDSNIDVDSVITSTRFAFDAEVLASSRYQRALDYLHRIENRQAELKNLNVQTVASGNIDQSRTVAHAYEDSKNMDDEVDNHAMDPMPPSITIQHQIVPAKSSVALAGDTRALSSTSSQTFVLPEISVGAWDLSKEMLSEHPSTTPAAFISSTKDTEASLKTDSKRHRRAPSDSIPQLSGFAKSEVETIRRSKSVGAENAIRPQLSTSSLESQMQPAPNLLSPVGAPIATRPLKPTLEWLDETFDTTWAEDAVGKLYQSRTLTTRDIVFVGDACVGSSSAIVRAVNGSWMTAYQPTVLDEYALDVILNGANFSLRLWDTGEHFDQLRHLCYTTAHVVVICYAIDSPDSLANVREKWIEEISRLCPSASLILLGCKLDLRDNTNTIRELENAGQRPVTYGQGLSVARRINAMAYMECSSRAEEGGNLTTLFSTITKCCVLHGREIGLRRARRQHSIFNFARKFSRSAADLTTPMMVKSTFHIEGGRILQPQTRNIRDTSTHELSNNAAKSLAEIMSDNVYELPAEVPDRTKNADRPSKILDVPEKAPTMIISIKVLACIHEEGQSWHTYTFQTRVFNGHEFSVKRTGREMKTLHHQLLRVFPELPGNDGSKRVIPYMPTPDYFSHEKPVGIGEDKAQMANYIEWIVSDFRVLEHDLVQQFFSEQTHKDKEMTTVLDTVTYHGDSVPSSPDTIYTFSPEILRSVKSEISEPDESGRATKKQEPSLGGGSGPHPRDEAASTPS